MLFSLLSAWVRAPFTHYRLFHNFVRQDFTGQFAGSLGGKLWLFVTPVVNILIYSFVFSVVFQLAHSGGLTGAQAVVALTVMTLFVPCIANFLMIVRERGIRVGVGILAFITPVAVLTGALLHYVLTALDIRF